MADLARARALWESGQRLEAEREIGELLRLVPDHPEALSALAEICAAGGRAAEAAAARRRLERLHPGDPAVLRRLGQALLGIGATAEAVGILTRAVTAEPGNARGHNNLGLALLRAGDAAGAAASLERAVALDPQYALAFLNLGLARQELDELPAARAGFERALELDPHLSLARMRIALLLRNEDAAAARRERDRALESDAINLMTVGRHDAAIAVWTDLIEGGAALAFLPGQRFHCRLHCCDWTDYAATAAALEAAALRGEPIDLPFSFFVHSDSAATQLACAKAFVADRYPTPAYRAPAAPGPPARPDTGRIRVAYLSSDLHEHATAYLVAGLLERHDRSRFEIVALSYGRDDGGPMRARLERAVDRFLDVSRWSDGEVADWMRAAGIHIAVDLKGHTGGARTGILARRAAPLQVNFLGYPGTMGADFMDYIVADRHVIPPAEAIHYSERVIYLPHSYQPNDAARPLPAEVPPRAQLGLPDNGFVFCSFNNLYKITPAVFDAWTALLGAVAGSVLWLLEGNPVAMRSLRGAAAARGIAPERLVFAPHWPLAQHLARYRHADLFLDTLPCNAHTTASDALWMGVPLVTITGRSFAGRVAGSLLHAVGLPELCTTSLSEYGALALRLAGSPAELARFRAHLEGGRRGFPLFDDALYCHHLETAYAGIWERRARGAPPGTLSVEPAGRRSEGAMDHE